MHQFRRSLELPNLEQVLEVNPLIVPPETCLEDVIAAMSHVQGDNCKDATPESNSGTGHSRTRSEFESQPLACDVRQLFSSSLLPFSRQSSYALIVEQGKLVGILTEGDLVRLAAAQLDISITTVGAVMTRSLKTLKRTQCSNILFVLSWLRQHSLHHLPVLNEDETLLGVITLNSIRQALKPLNFLKSRRIEEVATTQVTKASPQDSVLHLAQIMANHQVSCVVICKDATPESNSGTGHSGTRSEFESQPLACVVRQPISPPTTSNNGNTQQQPLGMVTARDVVQFQALGLNLSQTKAQAVMSTPLFLIRREDSLQIAQQKMQQYHIRRLVVIGQRGELAGIVTQTDLLKVLNSVEVLGEIEKLHQAFELQGAQLQQTQQKLEAEVAENKRLKAALEEANALLQQKTSPKSAELIAKNSSLKQKIAAYQDAQALLAKSETELKAIFNRARDAIVILDDDGRFVKVNPAACDFFALDSSELLTYTFQKFLTSTTNIQSAWQRFLEPGEKNDEIQIFLRDGTAKQVEYSAIANFMPHRHLAILRDVTARHQAEIQLQQERDFTTAILDTVGALVTVLDRQGRIIRFNHTCEEITGYRFAEVREQKIWDFLVDESEKQVVKAVFQRLLTGQIANRYENHWLAKDGSRYLISWSNTALFDEGEQVEFIIATGIDISEQRRILNKLEHQYRHTRLLAELTRKIRMSSQLDEILQTTVTEIQNLLVCDRVMIVELQDNDIAVPLSEAVLPDFPPMLGYQLSDPLLMGKYLARYRQGKILAITDLNQSAIAPEIKQLLRQFAVRAKLVVPILNQDGLQGLLIAHQCSDRRQWASWEIELLQQLADQISVALSQAQLLNNLEELVKERTSELTTTNEILQLEIRERQLTEIALRENQQKLTGILDNADEAIISIDEQQHIQLFNQGAEKIFGYRADEVMGQPLDILIPQAFRQIHRQHVRDFATSPESSRTMAERSNQVFGRRKNGSEFPAEASISKLRSQNGFIFTVMLKDITERQQAEQAIRRSEQQMRLITDALPLLIAYVDREQRYRFNNKAYERWFERTVSEIEGCYIWDVLGSNTYEQIRPYVDLVLSGHSVNFDLEIKDKNNNPFWINVNYVPDFSESGKVKGFFAAIDDITERKEVERLKGEFVSVASHEMRTPLTSIHGVLKLIAAGHLGKFSERGKEMIEIALRNTDRLVRLINDVLDLERMESGRETIAREKTNSMDLIQQAADTMRTMAQEHDVNIVIDSADLELAVDHDRILQTLTNLLSNAIKFSPAHSTIWVTAQVQGNDVLFAVKDCGRGIPADKLESIFERFQQIDASDSRKKGGTGLGLAICRHIVEQHQGKIWVDSILGEGSTFYFTLPR